jgi:hypothetical protein
VIEANTEENHDIGGREGQSLRDLWKSESASKAVSGVRGGYLLWKMWGVIPSSETSVTLDLERQNWHWDA